MKRPCGRSHARKQRINSPLWECKFNFTLLCVDYYLLKTFLQPFNIWYNSLWFTAFYDFSLFMTHLSPRISCMRISSSQLISNKTGFHCHSRNFACSLGAEEVLINALNGYACLFSLRIISAIVNHDIWLLVKSITPIKNFMMFFARYKSK